MPSWSSMRGLEAVYLGWWCRQEPGFTVLLNLVSRIHDLSFATNDSENQSKQSCQHIVKSLEVLCWRCKKGEHVCENSYGGRTLHLKGHEHVYGLACVLSFPLSRPSNPEPRLISTPNTDLHQICTSHCLSHPTTAKERWARTPFASKSSGTTALKSSKTSQKPTAHTAGKTGKDWY